ncbi:MAG: hypothetical protein AAGF45_08720 [Pseudomonadota bacterium]
MCALFAFCGLLPASADPPAMTACEEGLSRSLQVMEEGPLMKEEKATALMWLRLDARAAADRGDPALCLDKLEVIETILGIEDRTVRPR